MIKAEHRFDLPISPIEAFDLLSDPAKDPQWQTACVRTQLLDGPAHVGGHYEITFAMVGRQMTFTVEVTDYEPGRRSRFKVLDGPFGYIGEYVYTETSEGTTTVHWTFEVDPGDYFGVMPIALVKKMLISQVKKDSSRLAGQLAGARR